MGPRGGIAGRPDPGERRIEGDETTLAADVAGRIVELAVREGDLIEAGQVLARLDDRAVRARVAQAERALAAAEATVGRARAEHAVSQATLDAGEKSLEVLRQEVPLQVETAGAELERARAEYGTAEAAVEESRARRAEAEAMLDEARSVLADSDYGDGTPRAGSGRRPGGGAAASGEGAGRHRSSG